MKATDIYQQWLNSPHIDEETKTELRAIADHSAEIEERFYKQLEFGTGGLRGVLGAGTNRINAYTIRRATQGLANYIATHGDEAKAKGVVIAHDSRHQSPELSLETALTFAANGINVYLFDGLRPTPELSFAVRELGAQAGIVLTASHNPPEYNGYKVYWEDGGQIVPALAKEIIASINKVNDFADVRTMARSEAEQAGLLKWIGEEIDNRYIARLKELCLNLDVVKQVDSEFKIVFTPLHGAGNLSCQAILREMGFTQVHVVPEQEQPDPNFSTVKSPNPEERAAFDLAIGLAQNVGADLIIGTDPDCDRVGVVVRDHTGEYVVLSGNQTGALLLQYLLSEHKNRGTLPQGATMVKTIVTSEMGRVIADRYGVDTMDTLTGFKYIGEQMRLFEERGDRTFLFGYEESYGYLAGTFVRDKDGVMSTMLIAEMAAYYKSKGMNLYDALQALYEEFGYFREELVSLTLKGINGLAQIQNIMKTWREQPPVEVAGQKIIERRDYHTGKSVHAEQGETRLTLPQENVLRYTLQDGSWFCLRPSGTEPKIKMYFSVQGDVAEAVNAKTQALVDAVMAKIESIG